MMKQKRTLQELRLLNRYTQVEVAEKTDVPFSTLVAYELGYRKVPVDRALTLAKFYGVKVEDIEFDVKKGGATND